MLSVEKFSYCFGRKFGFAHVPKVPGEVDSFSWQGVRGRRRVRENEERESKLPPKSLFS